MLFEDTVSLVWSLGREQSFSARFYDTISFENNRKVHLNDLFSGATFKLCNNFEIVTFELHQLTRTAVRGKKKLYTTSSIVRDDSISSNI